ncbi:hypothetical protein SARC_05977 [Sphaeroforma arctica JP610]|uniref:Uncharacterized protein n=1 Tax=Sphaeroforma arctica JP610 TaxID=667725 RepID=A0A0L0FXZ7_9EUKA|nr:hypothetical protein SARC_05977 [Sphaeroforma arctica JP610]KNC81705.1 hypothetical protein SARC_05977 [Sphaeroforma arctica JP610]|eukprot:XP_014155607.1 hypothetical protein SARC_05977 [Sphaeroforma arctica JP610]
MANSKPDYFTPSFPQTKHECETSAGLSLDTGAHNAVNRYLSLARHFPVKIDSRLRVILIEKMAESMKFIHDIGTLPTTYWPDRIDR